MIIRDVDKQYSEIFDSVLFLTDWRFSAAATGLVRYFEKNSIPYSTNWMNREDVLLYNLHDILIGDNEERYYSFVEYHFSDRIYNKQIQLLLEENTLTDDKSKELKELLKYNVIMKKVFKDLSFDGTNQQELLKTLQDNRIDIIRETYRHGKSTYANFCNTNALERDSLEICRIVGYDVDLGKKKKSLGFNWDYKTYVSNDFPEFDYIPFAFSRTREAFFINNNSSVKELVEANRIIDNKRFINENSKNPREIFFTTMSSSTDFLNFEVEIISKKRENDFFETMFVRKPALQIFERINSISDENITRAISFPCRYGRDEYLPILDIVVNDILNVVHLDHLIDQLLKDRNDHHYLIAQLIRINTFIYGGDESMDKNIMFSKTAAENVVKEFKNRNSANKISSYRNKLISSLTFKDYDRFKTILLQLSAYSGVEFGFAYRLFDDFESNKNIAYAFTNALVDKATIANNENIGGETNEK